MFILSIDTATSVCAVGVMKDDRCITEKSTATERQHNAVLPSLIDTVLQKGGINLSDIKLIAVSIGPGSFTGLRVGLSFVKGLAFGLGIPVVPVGTLDAIALMLLDEISLQDKPAKDGASICPLIIARKSEVFGRLYTVSNGNCKPIQDIFSGNVDDLELNIPEGTLIGGEGVKTIAKVLDQRFRERYNVATGVDVSAAKVGLLGWEKYTASPVDFKNLFDMEPLYMKEFTVKKRSAIKN